MKKYEEYDIVTKELLDTIRVGDLIKINDWTKPMRVKAVTENYFAMTQRIFSDTYYSVCEKIPRKFGQHNEMRMGMFHCGRDHWIFGCPDGFDYNFDNETSATNYLFTFEETQQLIPERSQISERNGLAIYKLFIKRA